MDVQKVESFQFQFGRMLEIQDGCDVELSKVMRTVSDRCENHAWHII